MFSTTQGTILQLAASWLLVLLLPGAAVAVAVKPLVVRSPILLLALAPALSVGSVFVLGEVLGVVGLPFGPVPFVLALVAVVAVAAVRIARGGRPTLPRPSAPTVTALALLALGVAIGVLVWGSALRGQSKVPPNRDSMNHGSMVRGIVDEDSIEVAAVARADLADFDQWTAFYPLGVHASAAVAHRVTGAPIPELLTGFVVLFAAVNLPLGLYVLARRLAADDPLVAGFAALLVPFIAMFPYKPIVWGGITTIVGLTMVPSVLRAVLDGVTDARAPSVAVAAIASVGLLASHTTQAFLLAVLVLVLVGAEVVTSRDGGQRRRILVALAAIAGGTVVLYLPTIPSMLEGFSERNALRGANNLPFSTAAKEIAELSVNISETQPLLLVLALAGLVVALVQRRYGRVVVALVAVLVLFFASAVPERLWESLRWLSSPWYYSYDRTSYNVPMFVAFFGGVALAAAAGLLGRLRLGAPAAALVVGAAFTAVAAAGTVAVAHDTARLAWEGNGLIGFDDRQAFRFLSERPDLGRVVLNQEVDGSAWMYSTFGLPTLMLGTPGPEYLGPQFDDRLYLARNIGRYHEDARVRELVDRYGIRYVYVHDGTFNQEAAMIDLAVLRVSPSFEQVYRLNDSWVFRLRDRLSTG